MRNKPIIGIIAKYWKDPMGRWSNEYASDNMIKLLYKKGAIPIIIPIDSGTFKDDIYYDIGKISDNIISDITKMITNIDGIILQGGLKSSDIEVAYAYQSIVHKKPIMGICAGFNNIARAVGIPLIEFDGKQEKYHNINTLGYRHPVSFPEESFLKDILECNSIDVNSIHKVGMNISDVNTDIVNILAISSDDTVEAFGLKHRNNVLAIKWHPELMMGNKNSNILFEFFVDICRDTLHTNMKYSYKMK